MWTVIELLILVLVVCRVVLCFIRRMQRFPSPNLPDFGAFFTLYPNPAELLLSFALSSSADQGLLIEFFDVRGDLFISIQSNRQQVNVDVSKWNAGTYLCRVRDSKRTFTQKFIKN
jgi:hypothetical protein